MFHYKTHSKVNQYTHTNKTNKRDVEHPWIHKERLAADSDIALNYMSSFFRFTAIDTYFPVVRRQQLNECLEL